MAELLDTSMYSHHCLDTGMYTDTLHKSKTTKWHNPHCYQTQA